MLDSTKTRLRALEDFVVDSSLPKFRKERRDDFKNGSISMRGSNLNFTEDLMDEESAGIRVASVKSMRVAEKKRPWWSRWLFSRKPKAPVEPEPTMSILEFFSSVKNSAEEVQIVEARAAGYEKALLNAKLNGQKALLEKLQDSLNAYRMETQMLAMGITKFVPEATIVEFYKQCQKGLRLDWVRNFTRTIPEAITAKKVRADEIGIFDNYAVLHYDPQAKSFAETEAEKAKRKDPILFGFIKGQDKLYVLGDWIDEYCDLTLEQLAETLGRTATVDIE